MATSPKEVKSGVFDWSTLSVPAGNQLFDTTEDKKSWSQYKLSEDQVSQFWRDGFLINIPVLTPQQCDLILEDLKHLTVSNGCSMFLTSSGSSLQYFGATTLNGDKEKHPAHELLYEYHSNQSGDPDNVLMHCLGHWRMTQLFHDLIFHPKVTVPCSQLLCEGTEKSVRFWHDQVFAKPAKHGGTVAWHQDYSYWTRTKPCMHFTCHIALDDQTEENGTLLYVPGSHRWLRNGEPLPVLTRDFVDMESIKTILTDEERAQFKPVPSLLKKGEASFHSSLTVHGSYGNRSDRPRRSAVLNYFADGVYSDSDGYMLVKPTEGGGEDDSMFKNSYIKKNQKMDGQFFPMVFDKDWIL